MLLTSWVDSLIDHDEKPRELDVLSRGQCDLWDDHQGCLEQRVICADTENAKTHRQGSSFKNGVIQVLSVQGKEEDRVWG